jgi:hypothetical protein
MCRSSQAIQFCMTYKFGHTITTPLPKKLTKPPKFQLRIRKNQLRLGYLSLSGTTNLLLRISGHLRFQHIPMCKSYGNDDSGVRTLTKERKNFMDFYGQKTISLLFQMCVCHFPLFCVFSYVFAIHVCAI